MAKCRFVVVTLVGLTTGSSADAQVIHAIVADSESDVSKLGSSVAALGDINGDGYGDFLAGARSGGIGGHAFVYSGFDGSVLFEIVGKQDANFGISAANAGDVNNDGVVDFIIGADQEEELAGKTRVYSGLDGKVLLKFKGEGGDRLGRSVCGAGDVNSDGFGDVIMGAHLANPNGDASGTATVRSGIDGVVIYEFHGQGASDQLGYRVVGAFDANGDGIDDFAASAIGSDETAVGAGSVRIYSGEDGSLLRVFTGIAPNHSFGLRLSSIGDVDADGADDLLVGAVDKDAAFSLVSSKTGVLLRAHGTSELLIGDVSRVGDIDLDGVEDYAVGDPWDEGGRVETFSGATGSSIFKYMAGPGDSLGRTLAGGIDVNRDGVDDVIAGGPNKTNVFAHKGNVQVLSVCRGDLEYLGGSCGEFFVPSLSLGECLVPGVETTLAVLGGRPNANLLLLGSAGLGETPVSGACSLLLDASTITVLLMHKLNFAGYLQLPIVIPAGQTVGPIYLQAVTNDVAGLWVSNGVSLAID